MIEKEYLVTEADLLGSSELCENCVGNGEDCHGDYLCGVIEKILARHEHVERTCTVIDIEYDEVMGARFALSCGHSTWHDGDGNAPNYCQDCGARVVSES